MLGLDSKAQPCVMWSSEPVEQRLPLLDNGERAAPAYVRISFPAAPCFVLIEAEGHRPLEFRWDAGAARADGIPTLCVELSR